MRVETVEVRFGGVAALAGVDLEAAARRVTGLIGPNGAGKTTLFNVITGLQAPTAGRVYLDDRDITDVKPHQRARLRMARTFQRLEVFGSLTTRENIMVAAEARRDWTRDKQEKEDPTRVTEEILDRVGLRSVAASPVDSLPTGLARLVELGRAMATRPRLLLLDEPGSGLDEHETEELAGILLELAREGMAVLLVEHDVELVMRVCTEIFVLDFGRLIAQGTPAEIQGNELVHAAYLGTEDDARDTGLEAMEDAAR
ncbi:MAG TPA: ABC transporter ATP-binding protein [Acidimicrobiales bacterium]|nr:ABC transporter ATP-binding protein [Acidimicrobiales bacterium]